MSVLIQLKNIYRKLGLNSESFYKIKRSEQEKYLNSLGNPTTSIDKSFNQYKCQAFVMNKYFVYLLNLVSFFVKPFYIEIMKRKNIIDNDNNYDAIFISGGISKKTIPISILDKYKKIKVVNFGYNPSLVKGDIDYLKNKFRDKRYPSYFKLKIYIKMSMYSTIVRAYNPKAIISYVESSFTSQILTDWLEEKNIKHINIMHGEKLYFIADSFSHFSEFYVWDDYYRRLMIQLKADPEQFIIQQPNSLTEKINSDDNPKYYLTYYLSDENEKSIINISKSLNKIQEKGNKCKVRMHPRGNNEYLVKKYMSNFEIENPYNVTLAQSLESTKYICSLNSTVLYEGFLKGKKVILDDISNNSKFRLLKELGYIMIEKEHLLLSKLIWF